MFMNAWTKIGTLIMIVIVCVFVSGCVGLLAYKLGRRDQIKISLKVYYAALKYGELDHDSGLHEYIKARYYNTVRYVSDSDLYPYCTDFGAVDTSVLGSVPTGKGSVPADDYESFIRRLRNCQ